MSSVLSRATAWILVPAVVFFWIYAAILPVRSATLVAELVTGRRSAETIPLLPFMDEPPRVAARLLMQRDPLPRDAIAGHLRRALELRPLYAPTWMDLAELSLRQNDRAAATRYANKAHDLWPWRPDLLLRTALFWIRFEDAENSLRALRMYWRVRPAESKTVLALARRVEPDPVKLLGAVIPEKISGNVLPEYYLEEAMLFARLARDAALARAAWDAMPVAVRKREKTALSYIQGMLEIGRVDWAVEAWRFLTGSREAFESIQNPGFEDPGINGGFGWRQTPVEGVTVERDDKVAREGRYSLRLHFDGKHNPEFSHVRQTIPLRSGGSFRISGFWRGRGVTTRSGVLVEVHSPGVAQPVSARTDTRRQSWDWEPFALDIKVPEEARLIEVQLRRGRTDAFDRNISGDVWFDEFAIIPLPDGVP